MNKETLQSLREVVDYLYDDEERDYESLDNPDEHIFNHIKRLSDYLIQK